MCLYGVTWALHTTDSQNRPEQGGKYISTAESNPAMFSKGRLVWNQNIHICTAKFSKVLIPAVDMQILIYMCMQMYLSPYVNLEETICGKNTYFAIACFSPAQQR